jgi:hypothetical protein
MSTITTLNVVQKADEMICDAPAREWTTQWWKWFLEDKQQPQINWPVFFTPSKRMIPEDKELLDVYSTISKDVPILISVDKWVSFGFIGISSNEKMIKIAKERLDALSRMYVTMNGQPLASSPESHLVTRIMTPIFHINLKQDILNPELGGKKIRKGKYKVVADGYWLFLKPNSLDVGDHLIETFGSCNSGRLSLDVNHHITIVH